MSGCAGAGTLDYKGLAVFCFYLVVEIGICVLQGYIFCGARTDSGGIYDGSRPPPHYFLF